jgi:hypothetical protein
MRVAAFTACNQRFFPLLEGMFESLFLQINKGLKRIDWFSLCVFQEGLTPAQIEKLNDYGVKNVDVSTFDLAKPYPAYRDSLTEFPVSYGIRPLLPQFAENVDAIIWIDADIWFQDHRAVEDAIWSLHFNIDVCAVPVEGRISSYKTPGMIEIVKNTFAGFFGHEACAKFGEFPVLNMGFWGAKPSSSLWSLWQNNMNQALEITGGNLRFGIEESAFNYTIYKNEMPFVPLPHVYNCSVKEIKDKYALIDGQLCMAMVPFEKISAVHLSNNVKWKPQNVPILDSEGRYLNTLHTFLDFKSLAKTYAASSHLLQL